ncbi:MAG TPA: hypothetical protein DEF27_08340, partial [Oscillatoriales bacterium UBA8482]|nr:hypothetical protein [Oscillatoriales bacterium UBA8482]
MLVQVTLENVLSFKEETTFSMVGVNSDLNHFNHLAVNQAGKGRSLLPISAIYGANASGKSNLIKAINFAKDLIVDGTRGIQAIPISAFKLSDAHKKPSKFQFIFTYQENLYSYGFKLNRNQIFEEWLYVTPKGKKREVLGFERITNENKITDVKYGVTLKGKNPKYKQFLDFIAQGTRPNQLFLTEALDRNVQTIKPVIDWFRNVLTIIPAESSYQGLELGILSSQEFTNFLRDFLKFADTGIDSIGTEEIEFNFDSILPDIPENMREEILQEMIKSGENSVSMIESHLGKRYLLIKTEAGQLSLIQLRTQHRDDQGVLIDFFMEEESEGTQRLINLIPILFILQENPEKVIFLDELDRRLHPLLSRKFV